MNCTCDKTHEDSCPAHGRPSAPLTGSGKIIETIERIEAMEPMTPEAALLLKLAKEAQRTGKMPELSALPNHKGYPHQSGERW